MTHIFQATTGFERGMYVVTHASGARVAYSTLDEALIEWLIDVLGVRRDRISFKSAGATRKPSPAAKGDR